MQIFQIFGIQVFKHFFPSRIISCVMNWITFLIYIFKIFKCRVLRENDSDSHEVYRTFNEFCELYGALMKQYPSLKLHNTPVLNKFKESKTIRRRLSIASLIMDVFKLLPEVRDVYACLNQTLFSCTPNAIISLWTILSRIWSTRSFIQYYVISESSTQVIVIGLIRYSMMKRAWCKHQTCVVKSRSSSNTKTWSL